jgi:RimJ/RimL family protein N-acetyltransferase
MRLALGNDEAVAEWLGGKLGVVFHAPYTTMRVEDDQYRICGAYLFNNYNRHSIEVSVYGRAAIQRRFIRAVSDYAFNQLGVIYMRARTRRSNKRMVHMMPKLGFEYEGTLKRWYGPAKGDDALLFRVCQNNAMKWSR